MYRFIYIYRYIRTYPIHIFIVYIRICLYKEVVVKFTKLYAYIYICIYYFYACNNNIYMCVIIFIYVLC